MSKITPKRRKWPWILLTLALIAFVIIIDSNTRIVTDEYTLGNANLPESMEGLRIVHLSDVHAATFGKNNEKLLSAVRDISPDIICVTGDLVDGERSKQEPWVGSFIPELVKIAPVYYVSGNHEWAAGWARDLFSILREYGVTVLRNEFVTFGRGDDYIVIGGVDDPNGLRDQKSPEKVVEEINEAHPGKYVLMLAHRDTELDMWSELGVDAVLCGHAHGGLVRLPLTDGLVAPGQGLFPTWTAGIYEQGGTQMLVSRGVGGTKVGPVPLPRVFNNPEVVAITLQRP